MAKIKITVIKRTKPEEIFGEKGYSTPNGIIYTACSDGKRPVCFKLERLEE